MSGYFFRPPLCLWYGSRTDRGGGGGAYSGDARLAPQLKLSPRPSDVVCVCVSRAYEVASY